MSRNVYSEINLHFTWHVKNNAPVLTEEVEDRLRHYIKHKILETSGVFFHEIGGTEDHVHLVVSVPPTLLISEWVGKLKGGGSHYINHQIVNRKLLEWQDGYGVVSFGTKDLQWVIEYVRNQKAHHKNKSTRERLERIHRNDEA